MSRPRDSQHAKVFAVEKALTQQLHPSSVDLTIFTKHLVRSAWFKRRTHGELDYEPNIEIQTTRSAGQCVLYEHRFGHIRFSLKLGPTRYNQLGVLHALAHVMADAECKHLGTGYEAYHGRTFARCYLELVKHAWGNDAAKQLRALYSTHKVKRITVSEETREKRRASWEQRQIVEAKALWGDFIQEKEES